MALGFHLPALIPLVAPGPDALSISGDLAHFHFSNPRRSSPAVTPASGAFRLSF